MDEHDQDSQGEPDAAGQFRIYLGAAAGVGKTYAMLSEGHRRQERGADVAIAFVECHGRGLTERLIDGLEVIPRQSISYRGSQLQEMDLAAVLRREPQVALVDELAHTNAPGSGPHEKRWQDVLDLLAAGIDVITTVNIQHLESLADEVERMTGARVRERVPDWVVRRADQIELVDSSPEQLRRRLVHGNIYPSAQVDQALTGFFRPENLTALRELALRFLAAETGDELLRHLSGTEPDVVWETTERILVAVGAAAGGDALLRRAARIAARVRAELDVVHVTAPDSRAEDDREMAPLRDLAADLGARWHDVRDDDPVRAIARFARQRQVTQIVIGSSQRSRWQQLVSGGSNVLRLIREAGAVGIDVHVIARREGRPGDDGLAGADEPVGVDGPAGAGAGGDGAARLLRGQRAGPPAAGGRSGGAGSSAGA